MESTDTDGLRELAPNWSLAGDKKLLDVLQNIHQHIIQKCDQTNAHLEQMVASLDDADICLQNVNNRFMALSNRQFVECRVYDDDIDVTPKQTASESVQPVQIPDETPESEISKLKRSIEVIERMHSPVHILNDSDSETDSDDDVNRLVFKPKDLYAHRPLPYIIGSEAWKNKWHAGLLVEDSDSDSSVNKKEVEEYSDTDEEVFNTQTDKVQVPDRMDSSSPPSASRSASPPRRPADVAAEIARRLAGPYPQMPQQPPEEFKPPTPTTRKIYKPQQPVTGTIFSDEPPPLEQSTDESDTDIFAELHKNGSNAFSNRAHTYINPVEDLFGQNDMFGTVLPSKQPDKPNASLFQDDSEPQSFAEDTQQRVPENIVKRPPGGISLFGNKGTESIGAAILDRNRRSDEIDNIKQVSNTKNEERDARNENNNESNVGNKEKNILQDIFAKPEVKFKKQGITNKSEEQKPVEKKKIDLFSDNIFDDIDDIFTTSVTKTKAATNKKSIFDDDLFADIAKSEESVKKTKTNNTKSIFDGDDDLFSDEIAKKPKQVTDKSTANSKNPTTEDLADIINSKDNLEGKGKGQAVKIRTSEAEKNILDSDDELFSDKVGEKSVKSDLTRSIAPEKSKTNILSVDKEETSIKDQLIVKESEKKRETELFDNDEGLFNKNIENESMTALDSKVNKPLDSKDNITQKILHTNINVTEIGKNKITNTETEKSSKINIEQKEENTATDKSPKSVIFDSDEDIFNTKTNENTKSNEIFGQPSTSVNKRVTPVAKNVTLDKSLAKNQDTRIFDSEDVLFTDKQINIPHRIDDSTFDSDEDLFKNQNTENLPKMYESTKQLKTDKEDIYNVVDKINILSSDINKDPISETDEDLFKNQNKENLPKKDENTEQLKTGKKLIRNFGDISFEATKNESYLIEKGQNQTSPDFDEKFCSEVIYPEKLTNLVPTVNQKNESQSNNLEANAGDNITELSKNESSIDNKTSEDNKSSEDNNTTNLLRINTTGDDKANNRVEITHSINYEQILENIVESNSKPIRVSDNLIASEINKSNTVKSPSIFDDDDYDLFTTPASANKQSDILRTTKIISDHEKVETESGTNHNESQNVVNKVENVGEFKNVFEYDLLDDNIIGSQIHKDSNSNSIGSKIEKEMNNGSKMKTEKQNLFSQEQSSIFTDIFVDQPPIFEKPKEPKKSKNVNALFDDDSDDEALFFKKNDSTLDEKPDLDIEHSKFNLFLDEPPSIDHLEESEKLKDVIESPQLTVKSVNQSNENHETVISSKEDIIVIKDVDKTYNHETSENISNLNPVKSVSKLKPMNLNINVNTLLPGASPKKQKSEQILNLTTNDEETDGQFASKNAGKDYTLEANSELLDNKISKDRAKIQIKRRPSTRRARKEAARKSGIDYGEKSNPIPKGNLPETDKENIGNSSDTTDFCGEIISDSNTDINEFNAKVGNIKTFSEVSTIKKSDEIKHLNSEKVREFNEETDSSTPENVRQSFQEQDKNKNITSKIVYILNDEDIFKSETKTKEIEKEEIKTLGQMYLNDELASKSVDADKNDLSTKKIDVIPKKSLFDDLSDDESELFGAKKVASKGDDANKYKIKKESITTHIVKKEIVKGSLFSDDDDDDALFGVKTKKPEATQQSQTSRDKDAVVKQKETETVFVDPLSQLVEDD